MKLLLIIVLCLVWPDAVLGQSGEYILDASKSTFSFKVEHFGVATVDGTFSSARGMIKYDPSKPDSMWAQISIDVNSINTDNTFRDKELKSEDFLDAPRYPTVEFLSSGLNQGANKSQSRSVKGKMTVYGNTREVELPFTLALNSSGTEVTIRSQFVINREDYKLKFGILMDSVVGDEIRITTVLVGKIK
ncbi:MAG: YceI family protein [Bacteroidetes bacterium]|nr:YceI family protein [Bacteroidota bacterium]